MRQQGIGGHRFAYVIQVHWREYLIEAVLLGLFMISAGVFTTLLEYPGSPARRALGDPFTRRVLIGAAMGVTAITLIYSPWGRRSGAHMNPAITFTFWRLGKIETADAIGYIVSQFLGGLAGVLTTWMLLAEAFANPAVNFVVTIPGSSGVAAAFVGEALISFLMMGVVLIASNHVRLAPLTGLFAGLLVTLYITIEAPLSGMSLNPARTLASAIPAGVWTQVWVYFVAPPLGMMAAAWFYCQAAARGGVKCAKLHHTNRCPCIFRCGFCKHEPEATVPASNPQIASQSG